MGAARCAQGEGRQRQVLAAGGVLAGKTPSVDFAFWGRIPSGGATPPPVRCTQCWVALLLKSSTNSGFEQFLKVGHNQYVPFVWEESRARIWDCLSQNVSMFDGDERVGFALPDVDGHLDLF